MKIIGLLIISSMLAIPAIAQERTKKVPAIDIQTLDGSIINTKSLTNNGNPMIISFWATWCSPCKRELNNIAKVYTNWKDQTGVKLVAISIDDNRNSAKVEPYAKNQNWKYEMYLDPDGDFRKAMNVNNIPHTFIVNGKNEIIWEHNSYTEGDENEYLEVVKKIKNGIPISH